MWVLSVTVPFPTPLSDYGVETDSLPGILFHRVQQDGFNLLATLIFFCAIAHTLLCPIIKRMAKQQQELHELELRKVLWSEDEATHAPNLLSPASAILHFLGEVEVVFALWTLPMLACAVLWKQSGPTMDYLNQTNYTQPLFIVVTMVIASSRPIVQTVSRLMTALAGTSTERWWWVLLTVGPVMGSLITEPAAMAICATLLGRQFYRLEPSPKFSYATLALLFTNVSVGGALTHFAAAPIVMVAATWNWGLLHVFVSFGVRAIVSILAANAVYFYLFQKEFKRLTFTRNKLPADASEKQLPVPLWLVGIHLLFLAWTVLVNNEPPLFLGGFLFYIAFLSATPMYQDDLNMRAPLMVGLFLSGLVIHAGLQGWWIEPVIGHLNSSLVLLLSSSFLTAFNDNAAITYLGTLVPKITDSMQYALVAGSLCGGGLTVIANAPNPAGQALLEKYFPGGIEPVPLVLAAGIPTVIALACFMTGCF